MNKKELLAMPKLKVTPSLYRAAMADKPEIIRYSRNYEKRNHKIAVYLRCCTRNGILKVACFTTEDIRTGSKSPLYEIYLNKEEKTYLTYKVEGKQWLTASFWRLTWPTYFYSTKISCCRETQKTIRKYFGSEMRDAVELISSFQNNIMEERLMKKHKKVTDPWDEDLKQTPAPPKDFGKWVAKHGINEHYIFYHYAPKKLQKGFCSFCEREVEVSARHNEVGKCPHCKKQVRKSESPGQAYYTIEVEPGGTVRQKRTMYDRQEKDIDAASDFLRKWQHEIRSRMTKEDKERAKTSRILRLENFKDLTEKNVIINTGQLQGQRLVDVLMADLMEVA